jgi:hypothetical protein
MLPLVTIAYLLYCTPQNSMTGANLTTGNLFRHPLAYESHLLCLVRKQLLTVLHSVKPPTVSVHIASTTLVPFSNGVMTISSWLGYTGKRPSKSYQQRY